MTIYLVIPLLLIIAVVQATVMPHLVIWGVFPDLPLLVVVGWGLLQGVREGMVWGFIAGLAVDLLSGAPFGAATGSLLVVSFLSGLGKGSAFRTHVILMPLVTMFLATIIYDMSFLFIVYISGHTVTWLDSVIHILLPSAALNALLTPIVFGAERWLYTRFVYKEMEW